VLAELPLNSMPMLAITDRQSIIAIGWEARWLAVVLLVVALICVVCNTYCPGLFVVVVPCTLASSIMMARALQCLSTL
jgi:hypothetical protein